ncbi:adenylate/guanylate cyclase domain-containing protein [Paenibacillus sp. IB182496]|uniref:Adenylate/guanylate cyclase domain-containing protein n=1 Tax=Paenibacillus sabuli TaxID=2772509 RepID=A0A927GSI8_9BACL|nr:adenylate/guanylate cyclase domain-containing protein [Paenibacillus sabuli]MBD2846060.1 adenylate/guanylate cyclase domain-containing protein [Paenibacillus sabuli]
MAKRKWGRRAILALAIIGFWSFLSSLGTGGTLNVVELELKDLVRAKSDEERRPFQEIQIIRIDDTSLEQLGQFPWDRSLHAQLLEMLAEAGAKAIFLDLVFAEPSDPAADEALREVIARYDNIILPAVFNFKPVQQAAGELETESVSYPTEAIGVPDEQTAHINVMPDSDGTVRMLTLGVSDTDGTMVPAASVRLANYILGDELQIHYNADAGSWYRGEEVIPTNGRSQVKIDFFSEPREVMTADTGYESQAYFDVLTGNIPAEYYQDAVVLIGPWAAGMQDEYVTPANPNLKMYGVEIHSNMVQSLATGAFFIDAPEALNYGLIALLTLLPLMLFVSGRVSVILYFSLTAGYLLAWIAVYMWYSTFLTVSYPLLALTSAFIASIVVQVIDERKERGRVTTIFGRFVPRSVVDELLASGEEVKLGGQRKDITVMFVDIRGFTPMSERLQPEEVIQVLNAYLDLCTKAVFRWNGTLDKFIGDGVMAFFGAPVDLPQHPEMAVRAALEMKQQADVLEQQCVEQFGIGVKFGVGLHCGPAVVGNIGSEGLRLDYTAIGDTVNLAARLESNAMPGQILISAPLQARLGDAFATEDIGEIKVKGKEMPVRVYAVTGAAQ